MTFLFIQNPFIKAKDKADTKNLLHFHIKHSKKAQIQVIDYYKDYYFRIFPAIYLSNTYISFFITLQNSLKFIDC